jgi:hypothetical protein
MKITVKTTKTENAKTYVNFDFVLQNPGVYRIKDEPGFIVSFKYSCKSGQRNNRNLILYIDSNGEETGVPNDSHVWDSYKFYLATESVTATFKN